MTDTPNPKPKRIRRPAKPPASQHADMMELIQALKRVAESLEPLGEHVPVLVEIAKTWNAAATTGRTIGHGASIITGFGKWLGGVTFSAAIIWALLHQKWAELLGALK